MTSVGRLPGPGLWLMLALLMVGAVYLLAGLGPRADVVLPLRATRLAGMVVLGVAIAVATVLFQTVSRNRILTPQIMGVDALYILLQTGLVLVLGPVGFATLPVAGKFTLELVVMVLAALALFGTLLGRGSQDVARMILTGVILGILLRSLANLIARLMDPNAFAVVQAESVVSLTRLDAGLLPFAAGVTGLAAGLAVWLAPRLDVTALGRETAVALGLRHDGLVMLALALVAVLVAVATALVGPLTFLGLIVVALARPLAGSARHLPLLITASVLAVLMLVAGQLVFERVLRLQSALPAVLEGAGGVAFLWLLLKGRIR